MKRLYFLVSIGLAALIAVWFAVQGAQANAGNLSDTPGGIPQLMATWNNPGSEASQASVQRISTVTALPFLPFETSVTHIHEEWSGAMGTLFTFNVGSLGIEYISNLTYTANSGVTCSHDANLLITCTGPSITEFTVDLDWTDIMDEYNGNTTWWGYQGYSSYPVDYTFYLIFPDPLVYLKPWSLEPISVTDHQITWYQANTTALPGIALFLDPRVQSVFLPLMKK